MNLKQTLEKLESIGSPQVKAIYEKHGVKEPLYGIKLADLTKVAKTLKNDTKLAKQLFDTQNYDAQYLATMIIDPKDVTIELLEKWISKINCYPLAEYAIVHVAVLNTEAIHIARKWIKSDNLYKVSAGYNIYSTLLTTKDSSFFDLKEIEVLLENIQTQIPKRQDRIAYTMNGFLIAVGGYLSDLTPLTLSIAEKIGKVKVDLGKTNCKVPDALVHILKIQERKKLKEKKAQNKR